MNRSYGMAAASVKNKNGLCLIATAKQNQNNNTTTATTTEPRYNVGDKIRIASRNMPFRKVHLQQFSNEKLTNDAIHSDLQPSYKLRDAQNDLIQGKFYQPKKSKFLWLLLFNRDGNSLHFTFYKSLEMSGSSLVFHQPPKNYFR